MHGSLLRFRCDHCGAVAAPAHASTADERQAIVSLRSPSAVAEAVAAVAATTPMAWYRQLGDAAEPSSRLLCGACHSAWHVRPDVVLFGEGARVPACVAPQRGTDAVAFGAVLVVGTAGDVYPASAMAQHVAARCGCPVIVVDPAPTRLMADCSLAVLGTAEDVMPRIAELYL